MKINTENILFLHSSFFTKQTRTTTFLFHAHEFISIWNAVRAFLCKKEVARRMKIYVLVWTYIHLEKGSLAACSALLGLSRRDLCNKLEDDVVRGTLILKIDIAFSIHIFTHLLFDKCFLPKNESILSQTNILYIPVIPSKIYLVKSVRIMSWFIDDPRNFTAEFLSFEFLSLSRKVWNI